MVIFLLLKNCIVFCSFQNNLFLCENWLLFFFDRFQKNFVIEKLYILNIDTYQYNKMTLDKIDKIGMIFYGYFKI